MRTPLTFFMVISAGMLVGQVPAKEIDFERLVDEFLPQQDLDLNYEDIYENWMQLLSSPLDLNRATPQQLQSLFLLTDQQIAALIRHREEQGPFVAIYEIQTIPGFTMELIERLALFVRVGNGERTKGFLERPAGYWISRWGRTLEKRQGFLATDPASRFSGSPDRIYQRVKLQQGNLYTAGITAEKDAGEAVTFTSSQTGFDFMSGYVQINNLGPMKSLTVGDFQAQFGQGLLLGGGFGLGKGGETILTARRSTLGFLPYSSVLESGFFRGVGGTVEVARNLSLHGLLSSNKRDGRLSGDGPDVTVSSLPLAGLHRTPSEQAVRRTIGEWDRAAVLQYHRNQLEAGVIWHHTRFSAAIARNPNLYNQFAFRGISHENTGAFLSYQYKNFSLFAEHGYTIGRGHGTVGGMLGNLTSRLSIAMHVRNFQKNFTSFFSNAFSESTTPQNEQGIYWGLKYQAGKRLSLQGFVDQFRFPWIRYRAYAPGTGQEILGRISWTPSRTTGIFLQYRQEQKDRNTKTADPIYQVSSGRKQNFWLNADYGEGPLRFKSRFQWSSYSILQHRTQGMLLLQDIAYKTRRVTLTMRYALFDTEDAENRQYTYERDVWLAFSLPALSGRGIRQYAMLQYELSQSCTLWLRWSSTRYANQATIGSGADRIAGNLLNDLKIQLRFEF